MNKSKLKFSFIHFGDQMNKEGLSLIISTLMIVLLIFVAIGIFWFVTKGVLEEGAEDISSGFGSFFVDLKIENVKIESNGDVGVSVKRNVGEGDLSGIKFIFYDGKNSQVIDKETSLRELGQSIFTFTESELGDISFVKELSIAPVLGSRVGNVVDKFEDKSIIVDDGWILVWHGLPTQARYLLKDGEKVNINKPIKFNEMKVEGVNIDFSVIDTTSETAILKKTIPEYFKDIADEPDSLKPRVNFHDLDGNKDVTLIKNYFFFGYGNCWRVFYTCINVYLADYMYIAGYAPSCPPRSSFVPSEVGCTSTDNNYCQNSLDNILKDTGLELSKREYQETKVWVRLE